MPIACHELGLGSLTAFSVRARRMFRKRCDMRMKSKGSNVYLESDAIQQFGRDRALHAQNF